MNSTVQFGALKSKSKVPGAVTPTKIIASSLSCLGVTAIGTDLHYTHYLLFKTTGKYIKWYTLQRASSNWYCSVHSMRTFPFISWWYKISIATPPQEPFRQEWIHQQVKNKCFSLGCLFSPAALKRRKECRTSARLNGLNPAPSLDALNWTSHFIRLRFLVCKQRRVITPSS